MTIPRRPLALLALALLAATAAAFQYAPPPSAAPEAATLKAIDERGDQLTKALDNLRRKGVRDPALADVEVYQKAALWVKGHNEYYQKQAGEWALEALDNGLLRASQQARGETPWLQLAGQPVVRGYRSRIDGSVQPYAVTLPADYGKEAGKKWRIDVVLHGRNSTLTEVSFLHQHNGERAAPRGQDWVQIDIYGRGNNAYRWAGETDVYEALENFLAVESLLNRADLLDGRRVVLRGFSMGGAGAWHIGLHKPDRWCVIGPGAGFTTTHGYVKNLPARLPPYQEACLHLYDAVDYAGNAADVPVVAYAGADDPQLKAARNIEAKLKPLGIPMTLLVAPGLGHQFPPEWQKKAEAEYAKYVKEGRPEGPRRVRFVTWTLKYPSCDWVDVMALEHHYRRASVDAEHTAEDGLRVKTANVRALHLGLWKGATRAPVTVQIDGQELQPTPTVAGDGGLHLYLERRAGRWAAVLPERLLTARLRVPQKVHDLQGPIDDAFMGPFLCVRGSRPGWHNGTREYAEANLKRFQDEWSKYFRGRLPVKDDVEVTHEDIATRHLVLFGDPASNTLIEQVLPGLPLKWDREQITLDGRTYPSASHVPALIYPSPLATNRYVVLNTGHTFHATDFEGTNALLYPRLGDFAVLRLAPTMKDPLAVEVPRAGLFDDFWRLPRPAEARDQSPTR
jgi:hypothetical protein